MNSTVPRAVVTGLETGSLYRFFVVSRNDKGTSLPSALVKVCILNQIYWICSSFVIVRDALKLYTFIRAVLFALV